MWDAAHEPRDQPSARLHVEHGVFLGDADRIGQRNDIVGLQDARRLGAFDRGGGGRVLGISP